MSKCSNIIFNQLYPSSKEYHSIVLNDMYTLLTKTYKVPGFDDNFLKLLLSEAVTNAMGYGNEWQHTKKTAVLLYDKEKTLEVTIIDEGLGFNPELLSLSNPVNQRSVNLQIIRSMKNCSWNRMGNILTISLPRQRNDVISSSDSVCHV